MKHETDLYTVTIPPIIKALENLSGMLDKAAAHVSNKKSAEANLLQSRLVFDQFPLVKQIQVACDNAKGIAARLAGIEIPKFEDTETTFAELKERIAKTIAFVKTVKQEDVAGHEERQVGIHYVPGKHLPAFEYATESGLPNFYFHFVTAYSILRKNGVELGKGDYLGSLNWREGDPAK